MSPESAPAKKGMGDAVKGVFKNLGFYNGLTKAVVVPILWAMAKSSAPEWDDQLVKSGAGFVDKLLPPDPSLYPPQDS
jgi:hypothetical protein